MADQEAISRIEQRSAIKSQIRQNILNVNCLLKITQTKNYCTLLERKELTKFKRDLRKRKKKSRKCGRNFLRYCDADKNKKITLEEFNDCMGVNRIGCEADCKLMMSPSSAAISVSVGSNGRIVCSFSPDCQLSRKTVISPYWEKYDHVTNGRIVYINLTPTISTLFYNDIQEENMGEYQCHAKVGEQSLTRTVVLEKKSTI